jgi:hypothetical protein
MEPTIEPVEVGLLTRHATLPAGEAVLQRFAVYYRETLERMQAVPTADDSHAVRAAAAAVADAASFEDLAAAAAESGLMAPERDEETPAWDAEPVDLDLATTHDLAALAADDEDEAPPWANEPDEPEDPDDAPTRQVSFAAAPAEFFAAGDDVVDEAAAAAAWATEDDENLIQGDFFEDGQSLTPVAVQEPEEATRAMQAMPDEVEEATSMLAAMPDDADEATSMLQAMPDDSDGATTMMQAMSDDALDAVSVEALPSASGDDAGEADDSGPETMRSGRKTKKRSRKSKTMK